MTMSAMDRRPPSIFLVPFVLIIVGLFFCMALLTGQRDLTVLSLLLFSVAAGAKLWAGWSLTGIECSFSIDKRRLFPDEKLLLQATTANRKILPVWLQLESPVNGLVHDENGATALTAEAGLLWYQTASFRWELKARQRGIHHIGPLGIASGDLFGFFPRHKEMASPLEVVVYPRLVPLKPFSLPPRDFFGIPGADTPVDDPVYILGTRDYQYGHPAKHIHWKATARHHKLQEKIFEPSSQEKALLVVAIGPFAQHKATEEFERLLETAASAAVRLSERGCAVGLITNGRLIGEASPLVPVSKNANQLAALLETLARLQMEPARSLSDTFHLHLRAPWGISCLYFSLEEDKMALAAREYFMRRRMPFRFFAAPPAIDSAGPLAASGLATGNNEGTGGGKGRA